MARRRGTMKASCSRRARCSVALLTALALALIPAPASGEDKGVATGAAVFYTLADGDSDPSQLVAHLGIDGPDAFREVLLWNPQLHNIYALTPGTRLRVPGFGPRPAFPAFETDYSKWKIIASHTSRFVGSPWERVTNIIASANSVNNFFDNAAHPYIAPRDSLSLIYLLGEISTRTGYTWGKAIRAAEAGWVWWSAQAVVSQKVWLDGGMWNRPFWSAYKRDPHS